MPVILSAVRIGSLWIPFLVKNEILVGEIVNVFRRTINIRCSNDMLLSITALNYSSPAYVNVIQYSGGIDFQKHVKPYDEVFFKNSHIMVGSLRVNIDLDKEKIYLPRTCSMCNLINSYSINNTYLFKFYNRIYFLINIIDKPNNILELIVEAGLEDRVYSLIRQAKKYVVQSGGSNLVLERIYQLLGLGYGVTPSTDDFIGGLLGTLNIYLTCKGKKPLVLSRKRILSRTNWVSGNLLYYNHLGLFNSVFEKFVESVFQRKFVESIDSFLSLLSIGHTSGLDMGLGSLAALAIIGEAVTGDNIIDRYFDLFLENLS